MTRNLTDPRSYDERQADAVLTVCGTCQRAVYMVIPRPQCLACSHGCPPIGDVPNMRTDAVEVRPGVFVARHSASIFQRAKVDVSGVPIEGDY